MCSSPFVDATYRISCRCGRDYMATSPLEASATRSARRLLALTPPGAGPKIACRVGGTGLDMETLGTTTGHRRSVSEPLGVWLIGARGAVATTTIVGAIALRRGHTG